MSLILKGQSREKASKGVSNQLRNEGYIPAIIYGKGALNVPISVYSKDLSYVLNKLNTNVITLELDTYQYSVVLKELQRDKITGKLIHVDFQEVTSDEPIFKDVPIHLVGEENAKKSGIIQFQKREIEVRGLPQEIPHHIDLDISSMTTGTVVSVAEIPIPSTIELHCSKDEVVLSFIGASTLDMQVDDEKLEEETTI